MSEKYYGDTMEAFDAVSSSYDKDEAKNFIRGIMRAHSLRVLQETFRPGEKVLEIGCGTGTEAIELAKSNVSVFATDISQQMIIQLIRRSELEHVADRIRAEQCAAHEIGRLERTCGASYFDGAYSSFGALNCEPRLKEFVSSLAMLLKPNSRFVCSIMNKLCLFDMAVNALLSKRSARLDRCVGLPVGGRRVISTFYSPGQFVKEFRFFFTVERLRGLPAILPPPDFDEHVRFVRPVMSKAARLEWRMGKFPPFNRIGDHFLAVFRKSGVG